MVTPPRGGGAGLHLVRALMPFARRGSQFDFRIISFLLVIGGVGCGVQFNGGALCPRRLQGGALETSDGRQPRKLRAQTGGGGRQEIDWAGHFEARPIVRCDYNGRCACAAVVTDTSAASTLGRRASVQYPEAGARGKGQGGGASAGKGGT